MDDDKSLNTGSSKTRKNRGVLQDVLTRLDKFGHEVLSSVPRAVTVKIKPRTLTPVEQMQQILASERFKRELEAMGAETFEESEDFEVEDDLFPVSRHEYTEELEADDRDYRRLVEQIDAAGKGAPEKEGSLREGGKGAQRVKDGDKSRKRSASSDDEESDE